ncbi:baculoviral IAP repeat-containing protein 3-like isoform X1 [Leptopilina boulardi]|uniref:baculoviral IAP repeat-containing protein 3-like isoform X1 n=2 Tax=Leptopilina boulardi TaxID=63433 RepID=UPI0021F678D7|nr:baculoviral IAP repeat-containing protein 3-like isoform X1 [Leptopilina boulardi]
MDHHLRRTTEIKKKIASKQRTLNTKTIIKTKTMTDIIDHRDVRESLSSPLKSFDNNQHVNSLITQQSQLNTDEVDNVDYHFEAVRLQSYENWPLNYMDPAKLAAAGFYYTGESDKVKCFECHVEIRQWLENDDPMIDHQRWSGRCRFIRKIPCGNVPIGVDPESIPAPRPRSHDVCGPYGVEIRSGSGPDCSSTSNANLPSSAKLGIYGIGRSKGPVHTEYASYDARLRTFESWPKCMRQTKEQLADAGFYYTGKGDQTLCYHCGGGLKDWEPEDDPWEQHAKWFSKCIYLFLVKGQDYINNITGQHLTPPSKEETMLMDLPSCIQKVHDTITEKEKDFVGTSKNELNQPEKECSNSIIKDKEQVRVDDARMCKICYSEELGVVFLPCGHIVACVKCAPGMTVCAVCRKPVTMNVRAFFS